MAKAKKNVSKNNVEELLSAMEKDSNLNIACKNAVDVDSLGFKVVCYSCNTVFYDLGESDPKCPSCGTQYSVAYKNKKGVVYVDKNSVDSGIEEFDSEAEDELASDAEIIDVLDSKMSM